MGQSRGPKSSSLLLRQRPVAGLPLVLRVPGTGVTGNDERTALSDPFSMTKQSMDDKESEDASVGHPVGGGNGGRPGL